MIQEFLVQSNLLGVPDGLRQRVPTLGDHAAILQVGGSQEPGLNCHQRGMPLAQ